MKTKPITPYERLMDRYRKAVSRALFPTRKTMWHYPKERLGEGWQLTDLAERTKAADQLGYDVRLCWIDSGLQVEYVQRFVEPA